MSFYNKITVILFVFHLIYSVYSERIDPDYDIDRIPKYINRRLDAVPSITVKGSHFVVGFTIGQTFGKLIQDFVENYEPLKVYLEIYLSKESDEGRKIYDESLRATNEYFPQYLIELKGIAKGSNVPFHKLFLIHLDDILTSNVNGKNTDSKDTGCSSLMVNLPKSGAFFLGHNEDALIATINRFYIVDAHIIPSAEEFGGRFEAREEKWEAMTYAASLSGYASSYNQYGLVVSINTIFAKNPIRGRIPRVFLARALLACKADIKEIKKLLKNEDYGVADAFHLNAVILDKNNGDDHQFYSIEVVPTRTKNRSLVNIEKVPSETTTFHANRLYRSDSDCEELKDSAWKSSIGREERFKKLTSKHPVKNQQDILKILRDDKGMNRICRNTQDDFVNTINTGIFDLKKRTWMIWVNGSPQNSDPIKTIQMPLKFKDNEEGQSSNEESGENIPIEMING